MLGTDKGGRLTLEEAQNYQEIVFPQGARFLKKKNKSKGLADEQARQSGA